MNTSGVEATLSGKGLFKNELIPQRNKFLLDECKQAAKRMGQNNVNEDVFMLAFEGLRDEILNLYSFYSLEEITDVMYLGAKGDLGDNVSISFRTFATWFKEYHKNYRSNLIKRIKANPNQLQIESKPVEKDFTIEDAKEHLNSVIEDFKISANLYAFSYDIFEKYGLTSIYTDNKELYNRRGRAIVKEKNNNSMSSFMRKSNIGTHEAETAGKIEALKVFLESEIKNQ